MREWEKIAVDKSRLRNEYLLFDYLASFSIQNKSVYDILKLNGRDISLFEVFKPHLVLYIFPNVFNKNRFTSFIRSCKILIKIFVSSRKSYNSLSISRIGNFEGPQVGLFNFSSNFYQETLEPLLKCNDRINYYTIEKNDIDLEFNKRYEIIKKQINKNIFRYLWRLLFEDAIKRELGRYNKVELILSLICLVKIDLEKILKFYLNSHNYTLIKSFNVLISNDFAEPFSRLILLIAKKESISTVLVQQGTSGFNYPEYKLNFLDYTLTAGVQARSHILSHNPTLKNVIVTGTPNWDLSSKEEEYIPGSDNRTNLLLATQPYFPFSFENRRQRVKILFSIIYLAIIDPNLLLTIKPHPSEGVFFYKIIAAMFRDVVVKKKRHSINELIKQCDIFITSFSQTSIAAVLLNRPAVCVYFSDIYCDSEHIYSGGMTVISSYGQLKKLFKNKFASNVKCGDSEKLVPWIFKRDGLAAQRIHNFIIKEFNICR